MEVREALEDAIASNDQTELSRLRTWASEQRDIYINQISLLLQSDLDTEKAGQVRLPLNALRYMQRMLEQMPDD